MVSFGRLDLCLRMYRSNSSSIALRTGAIDGNANNWLLASGALLDRIGRMTRPKENLPRSSSRNAKGSVIAVPRSSAAALCALRTGRMLASRMKTVTKNRNALAHVLMNATHQRRQFEASCGQHLLVVKIAEKRTGCLAAIRIRQAHRFTSQ